MRHGVTEMNVHLSSAAPGYGKPGFVDPLLFDTSLTPAGERGARAAAKRVARLSPKPELLVVSPLSRALHTALLAFGADIGKGNGGGGNGNGGNGNGNGSNGSRPAVVVEPLFRERLYLSSDVGSAPAALAARFPQLGADAFGHLPDVWVSWGEGGKKKRGVLVRGETLRGGERDVAVKLQV